MASAVSKKNKCISTETLIEGFHIDRGINASADIEAIVVFLKNNPSDFNEDIADKLLRAIQITKNCFYDCYDNSNYKHTDLTGVLLISDT